MPQPGYSEVVSYHQNTQSLSQLKSRPRAAHRGCGGTATPPDSGATTRGFGLALCPWFAVSVDDLAPPLERLAWAQPHLVALLYRDRLVVGSPPQSTVLQHLAPEPDQELAVGRARGRASPAASAGSTRASGTSATRVAAAICGRLRATAVGHQRVNGLGRRPYRDPSVRPRRSTTTPSAGTRSRTSGAPSSAPIQRRGPVLARSRELREHRLSPEARAQLSPSTRSTSRSESVEPEQLGRSRARRRAAGADRSSGGRRSGPTAARRAERDRHRRADAHVAQVLEVDRRDAAQPGVAEVERPAGARVRRPARAAPGV